MPVRTAFSSSCALGFSPSVRIDAFTSLQFLSDSGFLLLRFELHSLLRSYSYLVPKALFRKQGTGLGRCRVVPVSSFGTVDRPSSTRHVPSFRSHEPAMGPWVFSRLLDAMGHPRKGQTWATHPRSQLLNRRTEDASCAAYTYKRTHREVRALDERSGAREST